MTIYYESELYHHGVKGMKWGVRRNRHTSPSYNKMKNAKNELKKANQEYSKSFNKAYNRSISAYSPSKKRRKANEERWKNALDKAEAYNNASKSYKEAKKEYKAEKKADRIEKKSQKKASIENGRELSRRLKDRSEIRWNEDRNNRLIKKMSKKDWDDIKAYEKDAQVKSMAAAALMTIGTVGVITLNNRKH